MCTVPLKPWQSRKSEVGLCNGHDTAYPSRTPQLQLRMPLVATHLLACMLCDWGCQLWLVLQVLQGCLLCLLSISVPCPFSLCTMLHLLSSEFGQGCIKLHPSTGLCSWSLVFYNMFLPALSTASTFPSPDIAIRQDNDLKEVNRKPSSIQFNWYCLKHLESDHEQFVLCHI